MEFSNEVLAQILSQISDHKQMSLVSPRLHQIICEYKLFVLRINGNVKNEWEVNFLIRI